MTILQVIGLYLWVAIVGMFIIVLARTAVGGKWDNSIKCEGETGIEALIGVFVRPLLWPLVIGVFCYKKRGDVYKWLTEPK